LFSSPSTSSANERELLDEIAQGEEFTRFILSRNHFAPAKGRVKAHALMPMRNQSRERLETSTHRIAHLTDAQIWHLGQTHVANPEQGRTIKARGTGPFELVTAQQLSLDVNGEPYPRHVDVVGWPHDKDDQLMKATEIADKLTLELGPTESLSP
jgi:hypothetical protein